MSRGKIKRRKGHFNKGHSKWKKIYEHNDKSEDKSIVAAPETKSRAQVVRFSAEEFNLVAQQGKDGFSLKNPDCEGVSNPICLLRPKKKKDISIKEVEDINNFDGMRLVNLTKVTDAFNEAFKLHRTESNCLNPEFKLKRETKWGLGWKIALKCKNCHFQTKDFKLYDEIHNSCRGPNPAAINVGLGIGLQDTPVGNRRARLLFAAMNTPPPARSAMQKTSNKVSRAVLSINENDMKEKLKKVMETNKKRGNDAGIINIAMDGRYNSSTITSRKKPGQNASQAIGIAVETMTDQQLIVGASFQNQLCWVGSWLRGQGFDVKCPGGHADCTANVSSYVPLSEYNMGKEIATKLFSEGAKIRYATTDGDSKSSEGIKDALNLLQPMWKVDRLADPTHLGQVQFKKCYNANFSRNMFPGCITKDQQATAQKVLSQDVKARCSLILKELMKKHAGDMTYMKNKLPKVLEATLLCYCGDCSKCYTNSVVCGGGVTNNWFHRSMFLATNKITVLNLDANDAKLLLEILKVRLSLEAVEKVKFYTSTQKCEAVNRSLSVSLPKNVNFSRNVFGRASSTIHRRNNGTGKSVEMKCEQLGCNLSMRSRKALQGIDREEKCAKDYVKCPSSVKQRMENQARRIREHVKYRSKHLKFTDYKKGHLDHFYSA